jgi:single-stranded DNA-binding protein
MGQVQSPEQSVASGFNTVVLVGHLSSAPQRRTLASGSELWSFEVTTPTEEGSWSVPVAWFDPAVEPAFSAGDAVVVLGSVKRRFFRGVAGTQSRTEVVAADIVPATARQRVRRLLQREAENLGARSGGALRSSA